MSKTKIAWVKNADGTQGKTWNPIRGCEPVSRECANCYARTFAERWRGIPGHPYEQGFDLRLVPEALEAPTRWTKPRTVFVCSMSDLFYYAIPEEYRDRVFQVMESTSRHRFQILTKRAEVMRTYLIRRWSRLMGTIPPNILAGVTVGARSGLWRLEALRTTPAAVRFLSIEPLLEDLGALDLTGIHWVIVGGESGARARPMDPDWARSIRDQCVAAGVPFFYKQGSGRTHAERGNTLDGETWAQMPAGLMLHGARNTGAPGNPGGRADECDKGGPK